MTTIKYNPCTIGDCSFQNFVGGGDEQYNTVNESNITYSFGKSFTVIIFI